MNQFYKVVEIIRNRLESNENCNTVLFGTLDTMDFQKKNIYPLAIIEPTGAPLRSSAVSYFTFNIGVFDQRTSYNKLESVKFDGNDDIQDNLNITYTILNDLMNYLRIAADIEIDNIGDGRPALWNDINVLDGWVASVTIKITNNQEC